MNNAFNINLTNGPVVPVIIITDTCTFIKLYFHLLTAVAKKVKVTNKKIKKEQPIFLIYLIHTCPFIRPRLSH